MWQSNPLVMNNAGQESNGSSILTANSSLCRNICFERSRSA